MNMTSYRSVKTAAFTASTVILSTSSLFAADEAAPPSMLKKWVIAGDWPMILIGLLFVALLALCIFNFMNLTKTKFCPDDLKAGLMDHMMNCRVRSAIELGASHPSYLGRMMAYALPNVDARRPEAVSYTHLTLPTTPYV